MAGFYLSSSRQQQRLRQYWSTSAAGISTPLGATFRYFRMYITANNGGAYTGLSELELRGTIGGTKLNPTITGSDARVLVSSEFPGAGGYLAFNANLGGTSWFTNTGAAVPCYIGWDFGTPTRVAEIAYGTIFGGAADRAPKDFRFEGSNDNASWTIVGSQTGKVASPAAFVAYPVSA